MSDSLVLEAPAPRVTESWRAGYEAVTALTSDRLFFIGASPRSGTVWLQTLLDAHPAIACRGEAHFGNILLPALNHLTETYNAYIATKNNDIYPNGPGFAPFADSDLHYIAAAWILLALKRQAGERRPRLYGEKTPDNVRCFPLLRFLFANARFLHLVRDPRDVLISTWYHNRRVDPDFMGGKSLQDFVRDETGLVENDAKQGLAFGEAHPDCYLCLTFDSLSEATPATLSRIFRFLGVADTPEIRAACIEAGTLTRQTAHFRSGLSAQWRQELTPETNTAVAERLNWLLTRFGWPER